MTDSNNPNPERYTELVAFVRECFPYGDLLTDNHGQYIIYTGLKADPKTINDHKGPVLIRDGENE